MSALRVAENLLLPVVRLAAGGLFLFSAWIKLAPNEIAALSGSQKFALALNSYDVLPPHLVTLGAFVIPWMEVIAGLCLVLGFWTRSAGLLLSCLMIGFTGGVVSVILRGMKLDCGCFGDFKLLCQGPIGWCKVGENALIIAATLLLAWRGGGYLALDRLCARPADEPATPA